MEELRQKAIINGTVRYVDEEELGYLKRYFGFWEKVYIFNSPGFYGVTELADLIKIKTNTVYQRNRRNPDRYPLEELGGKKGVFIDTLFKYWFK